MATDAESVDAVLLDELAVIASGTAEVLPFRTFVESGRGAFPVEVERALVRLHIPIVASREETENEDFSEPELHPLSFEWMFTPETVEQLVRRIGNSLCNLIGLPSVAARLAPGYVLIESNPFVGVRNPALQSRGTLLNTDIQTVAPGSVYRRPVVGFDPPWYFGETLLWLNRASEMVSPGGEIFFSLFPERIRPTAYMERDMILKYAADIGNVSVDVGALSYITPRFEQEALRASSVPTLKRWRRGDLVSVRMKRRWGDKQPIFGAPVAREHWRSYRVGSRIVKVRERPDKSTLADARTGIHNLDGLVDFQLPSVSLRDDRRHQVDVWTSRNRVATVTSTRRTHELLERLHTKTAPEVRRSFSKVEWTDRRSEAQLWLTLLGLDCG